MSTNDRDSAFGELLRDRLGIEPPADNVEARLEVFLLRADRIDKDPEASAELDSRIARLDEDHPVAESDTTQTSESAPAVHAVAVDTVVEEVTNIGSAAAPIDVVPPRMDDVVRFLKSTPRTRLLLREVVADIGRRLVGSRLDRVRAVAIAHRLTATYADPGVRELLHAMNAYRRAVMHFRLATPRPDLPRMPMRLRTESGVAIGSLHRELVELDHVLAREHGVAENDEIRVRIRLVDTQVLNFADRRDADDEALLKRVEELDDAFAGWIVSPEVANMLSQYCPELCVHLRTDQPDAASTTDGPDVAASDMSVRLALELSDFRKTLDRSCVIDEKTNELIHRHEDSGRAWDMLTDILRVRGMVLGGIAEFLVHAASTDTWFWEMHEELTGMNRELNCLLDVLNDFTDSDLSQIDLSEVRLGGIRWSKSGTLWPQDRQEEIRRRSEPVHDDVYVIRSNGPSCTHSGL